MMNVGVENTRAQMNALFYSTCFGELDSGANLRHSLWVCWSVLEYWSFLKFKGSVASKMNNVYFNSSRE